MGRPVVQRAMQPVGLGGEIDKWVAGVKRNHGRSRRRRTWMKWMEALQVCSARCVRLLVKEQRKGMTLCSTLSWRRSANSSIAWEVRLSRQKVPPQTESRGIVTLHILFIDCRRSVFGTSIGLVARVTEEASRHKRYA